MYLKEFFKPTKKKVVLTIILTILYMSFLILGLIFLRSYVAMMSGFIESLNISTISTQFNLKTQTMYNELLVTFVIQIVMSLILYYFISCVLIWIFYGKKKK
jgi:hypothetical protein